MTDKGEILNEAEVDFLLAAAGEEAEAASTPGAAGQSVTMRGDLEQINLADIFQTLAMSKMEGVLCLRNPLEERSVHCRDGYVRILLSNRASARRLGQRLIKAGLVQPDQLRSALLDQRQLRRPLGQVVVAAGLVTQEQVDAIVATQVSQDLFSLFTWRHGSFEFWKGPVTDPAQSAAFDLCPEFEVSSLLLEVARRSDEWQSILAAIGSVDDVPKRCGESTGIEAPTELHSALFAAINGELTYRDMAEQTTAGLFEMARAARDLVHSQAIINLEDVELVAVAVEAAGNGQGKKALLLLQTLRDRTGERSIVVLQGMATALQKAGEKRLAGNLLIEAAQRQADPTISIELAHRARDLAPYDPATLSYLRTVLLAHADRDDAELEQVTVQLLDALIASDDIVTVRDIVQDARATETASAIVLQRLARAQQKVRDVPAAIATWLEVAGMHDAAGARGPALEAYEAVLRLDRSRKDIAKLLRQRRRTRVGRIVRVASMLMTCAIVGGAGFVYWQESNFAAAVRQASLELDEMLRKGDRVAARERWEHWLAAIGACEAVEDMRNRIAFDEAAEHGRQQKLVRARVSEQMNIAAELLGRGELSAALTIYRSLHGEPTARAELLEVVGTRLDALLNTLEGDGKSLAPKLPPEPGSVFDRRELLSRLGDLQVALPAKQIRLFDELDAVLGSDGLPDFLGTERPQRARKALAEARPAVTRGRQLLAAYNEALQQNDTQRRLDPLFKAAVAKSAAHDFAGALAMFRELEAQPVGDATLRQHLHAQVERNATIVRLLDGQRSATAAGDFRGALEGLQELRAAFPDLPIEQFVQLPLQVDSQPTGAQVYANGALVGTTPYRLVRSLEQPTSLELRLAGFAACAITVRGDSEGSFRGLLSLAPTGRWRHDSMVEVPPVLLPNGKAIIVDRAGTAASIDPTTGERSWTWRSGDLSGLLMAPLLDGNTLLVASIDGDLRALDATRGTPLWSLPDLPTESTPVRTQQHLVLATTDKRLVAVRLDDRTQSAITLPEAVHANGLFRLGDQVIACGERGRLRAFTLPMMQRAWEQDLGFGGAGVLVGDVLVVCDERGHTVALRADTGAQRWHHELLGDLLGRPAAHGDQVLLTTADEIVRLGIATGQPLPAIPRGSSPWSAPALGMGARIVAPTRDGSILVLDTNSGVVLYRIDAARQSVVLGTGAELFVVGKDHLVQSFLHLR